MRSNYIHFSTPQFRLLSDKQIEELHLATLQILEKTGIAFNCQEAINVLGEAGADISNPQRVKIPSYLVEQALRTAPKSITLYTREGEPAIILNGMTGRPLGSQKFCRECSQYRRKNGALHQGLAKGKSREVERDIV